MIEFLKRINREKGVTIMVTSHDMDDLEEMARRVLMISHGRIAFDGSFIDLRSLTGNLTRLFVTMEGGFVPHIRGSKPLRVENGIFEYDMDLNNNPIGDLLGQLSVVNGIRDVEIKKAPIERVISRLYKDWEAK